jgi:methylated-DNA-[protein]-cysteine S-methyltransferase
MGEHGSGDRGYALFETAIGRCGIVWSARGIVGVQFPERGEQATRNRLLRRFPRACETMPPQAVQHTIEDIVALLAGERRDLSAAVLDCEAVPDFNRRVYDVARAIPAGTTLSYGEVAEHPRRPKPGPRCRAGTRAKSLPDHRAVPSRHGGGRQDRRLFGRRCLPISRSRRDRGGAHDPDHTLSIDACPDVM